MEPPCVRTLSDAVQSWPTFGWKTDVSPDDCRKPPTEFVETPQSYCGPHPENEET
jgi:hypothetical protein